MAVPGASTRKIGDLVPDVREALQQRTDVDALIPRYIRKSIIELTESNAFEELRRTGPAVTLTAGMSDYPVSVFLNNGDDYNYPESFVIYIDYPSNTVKDTIDYMTPKAIEVLTSSATQGIPKYFTRFGPNFMLGPSPNSAYSVFLRYQAKHPFPDDFAALSSQPLMLPDSWEEIVVYGAAHRIALVKRWNDEAKILHDILYGDPESMMPGGKLARPGLLAARVLQVERDQKFNSRRIGIISSRYTAR